MSTARPPSFARRRFLRKAGYFGGGLIAASMSPAWAQTVAGSARSPATLSGEHIHLTIGHAAFSIDGREAHGVAINGTVPGPLLRLREGDRVRIHVSNALADEDTSIHWHGLLVPFQMDGVPGLSFPGIKPGETFVYDFPLIQAGTYWYHSHSGLQEQAGFYAPIIVDPKDADPIVSDRDYVVMLSDHSFTHPHILYRRLKQQGGIFNFQKQTVAGLFAGKDQTLAERSEWAGMLMDPTDISDITGAVYTYLINGRGPHDAWTGLFKPGERVRLRFINAGTQTIFNVRLPGLRMSVVAADGQPVQPVGVDEFQIGNGETYDVIVTPADDKAYGIVAEAVDRSGLGFATLAPRAGMLATPPALRDRPLATMRDMGMDHGAPPVAAEPGLAPPRVRGSDVMVAMPGMDMSMDMLDGSLAPQVALGPGVQMIAPMPADRTGEPGQGLASVGHRVLVYRDLVALGPNPDQRAPDRAVEIHLTGNMERFIWGFDGKKWSDRPTPYAFRTGERVRVTLVNDTMMAHPIHLHGHYFELIHGPVGHMPRKHTVIVAPAGQVTFDVTPEPGDWAFHCHMLYHMHAGMFQVFKVRPVQESAT